MLVPAAILGIYITITDYQPDFLKITVFSIFAEGFVFVEPTHFFKDNILNEIVGITFTIGALLAGFSKEKHEDEYIASLRQDSLLWAIYVNYGLLIISMLFIYGFNFLNVMIYNMFTVLLIFLLRFKFMLYKSNKTSAYEK